MSKLQQLTKKLDRLERKLDDLEGRREDILIEIKQVEAQLARERAKAS